MGNNRSILTSLSGFETKYKEVLARATTLGYTLPSAPQQIKQNLMMKSLIDQGILSELDFFHVYANDGSNLFSTINWVTPMLHQHTLFDSPSFTTNQGFAGNGSSMYINTNFKPQTNGVKYQQNSASYGYYIFSGGNTGLTVRFGARTGFDNQHSYEFRNKFADINTSSQTDVGTVLTNGFRHFNRSGAATTQRFINGVLNGTSAAISSTPTNFDFYVLALNNAGTPSLHATNAERISIVFGGGDLSSKAAIFNTIVTNYITSL